MEETEGYRGGELRFWWVNNGGAGIIILFLDWLVSLFFGFSARFRFCATLIRMVIDLKSMMTRTQHIQSRNHCHGGENEIQVLWLVAWLRSVRAEQVHVRVEVVCQASLMCSNKHVSPKSFSSSS